jgi:hypothetical protein
MWKNNVESGTVRLHALFDEGGGCISGASVQELKSTYQAQLVAEEDK